MLDPHNPYVLAPQLVCAAAELPLTERDVADVFGGAPAASVLDELVDDGVLRRRPTGWYWPSARERPAGSVDIRGSGLGQVALVEAATGRMLGTVDGGSAPATAHAGAVYLHRGESYLVESLDLDGRGRPGPRGRPGLAHRCRAAAPTSRWPGCCSTATTARSGSPSAR